MNDAHRMKVVETYQATPVCVTYEDMANTLRIGTVVEHRAGEFRVMWDDEEGGETWSDLRQAGWRLATVLLRRREFIYRDMLRDVARLEP